MSSVPLENSASVGNVSGSEADVQIWMARDISPDEPSEPGADIRGLAASEQTF